MSRPTIANYVAVLEATFVVHVVRPWAAGGAAEIVTAPKVYGFDTGFVSYHRGWHTLRRDDYGLLWEHPASLRAFRGRYPKGDNFVVAFDVERPFTKRFGSMTVRLVGLDGLISALGSS